MWIRIISMVLFLALLSPPLFSQSESSLEASLTIYRIRELAQELEQNLAQQEILIEKLETSNEELSIELNEALMLLKESEESLKRQLSLSENLGQIIDNQAKYSKTLSRKLTFWRVTSGVLAGSLGATLILWSVSK